MTVAKQMVTRLALQTFLTVFEVKMACGVQIRVRLGNIRDVVLFFSSQPRTRHAKTGTDVSALV